MSQTRRLFADMVTARKGDEILTPRLRRALTDPSMKAFGITMPPMSPRKPDGWFHPSTHPLWGERQLAYYLASADEPLEAEVLDITSVYTIYQGHWLHGFTQHILLDQGLLVAINPTGKTSADKVEYPLADEVHRSRGHMDGLLDADALGLDAPVGLEIKSMNQYKLSKCPKGPATDPGKLSWFIEATPQYFAQAQEYMRLGGHRCQQVLIIAPSYPFDMVEIAVPYAESVAEGVAEKYASVLDHHRAGTLPDPCCAVKSPRASSCPARRICPIGKMSA